MARWCDNDFGGTNDAFLNQLDSVGASPRDAARTVWGRTDSEPTSSDLLKVAVREGVDAQLDEVMSSFAEEIDSPGCVELRSHGSVELKAADYALIVVASSLVARAVKALQGEP